MKRRDSYPSLGKLEHTFPPLTLYQEDMTRLVEAVSGRGAVLVLYDDEYEYESLAELKEQRGDKVVGLRLLAKHPKEPYKSIQVVIERGSVTLIADRTDELTILWHDVFDILSRRASWYLRVLRWPPLVYLLLVTALLAPSRSEFLVKYPAVGEWGTVLFLGVGVVGLLAGLLRWKQSVVYLKRQHEVGGFFTRNSDKIIVGVISAIVGVVIKTLADRISL